MSWLRIDIDALSARRLAGLVVVLGSATILSALAYEHLGGYRPCPLCLRERIAYYVGVPSAAVALAMMVAGRRGLSGIVLALVALGFLFNAGLGTYHSGAEWGLWQGPSDCSGGLGISTDAGELADSLATIRIVRCDEAPWRFLFLSFAGWNAVISAALAIMAARAAWTARG